jgi:citrate lyase subunit beta/citryl-CoA lyase
MAASYLFVPAHEARKVHKAATSTSEAIILDLEDSVPADQKERAREAVSEMLQTGRLGPNLEVWVRVNAAGANFAADIENIDWSQIAGAVLPKAEDAAQVRAVDQAGAKRIMLLVESAVGLGALGTLVETSRKIERLAFGSWDLMLDIGLFAVEDPDDAELMWQLRGDIVVDSRRLGLQPPIDGVHVRLDDQNGFRSVCMRARNMGFAGKLLVHPSQIVVAQELFGINPQQVELAQLVVSEYEDAVKAGRGAIRVNGRMVDRPMVEFARAIVARGRKQLREVELGRCDALSSDAALSRR